MRRVVRCDAPTSPSATATCGPDLVGRDGHVLETERDLVVDARHHDLVLGVLEDRRDDPHQLGRAVRPRIEAADLDPAGEAATVKVRHEPRECAQERRLAAAGRPEQGDDLARVELEREITYRRHAARVGEREPLDAR